MMVVVVVVVVVILAEAIFKPADTLHVSFFMLMTGGYLCSLGLS